MFLRLFVIGLLAAAAAGCGASVDAEGKVLTDRVWFDQKGVAHCPHPDCLPSPKLRPTAEETEQSLVKPHRSACEKGHPVTWGDDEVVCWNCQGAKHCATCKGTGLAAKDRACSDCLALDEESRVTGTGRCGECGGRGLIRYGGVSKLKR